MNMTRKYLSVATGVVALAIAVTIQVGLANVRFEFPEDSPGPPAYAEISNIEPVGEAIFHTEQWAAIPFYRDPSCVPASFNLLNWFDLGAFSCDLLIQGFEIWTAPPPQGTPIYARAWGLGAVPIYFVDWPELRAAVADRTLTIGDLKALPSLKIGFASFFSAGSHSRFTPKAILSGIEISARGLLQDGRQFQFQAAAGGPAAPPKHVKIVFR